VGSAEVLVSLLAGMDTTVLVAAMMVAFTVLDIRAKGVEA
jgi:hypothetical protein